MKKMFGLAAAAAVSLSLLTGCPAEDKQETTTTTTTTTTEASTDAMASPMASAEAGGHSEASPAPAVGASTPAKVETAAAAADGAAVFSKNNCAACHGAKGEGGVGPNLTKVEEKGDEYIRTTIRQGRGNMPKFDATQISDEQLDALITYVKSL